MATQISASNQPRPVPLKNVERDTITKIFFGAIDRLNRPDAMRYKQGGQWRTLSHKEIEERVTRLAAALNAMGVERGDRVAILSENRPEWAITDYACLCLGLTDAPLYPTLPGNQIAYILNDCSAKVILVSTREQLQKILEIRGDVPSLQHVIAFDDAGGADGVRSFADVLEQGQREIDSGNFGNLRERALAVGRDDLATLIYTSGTTGNPKGVMLTHYNLASNVAGVSEHGILNTSPPIGAGDVALSFLPLSHVFERMVDYFLWDLGVSIAYAESIEKVADNLQEVKPHIMVSVPRVFEKIYNKVLGATGIKAMLVGWAKRVGEAAVDERLAGRETGGFQLNLADKLVFSKLRERTGGRIKAFVSGGAPLSGDVAKFFFAAGLPIFEGYGLTETSPVLTANKPNGGTRLGTVGHVIPGVEVRIAESGEIIARGPNIMKGYWNNEEATREVIDEEGWFHTGDVGEFDRDGFLRITDRIKNIIVTAGGKNIAPAPIENEASLSPYVGQVVMIGDKRPFPVLLVVPDFENLGAWAKEQGIDTANKQQLVQDPRVRELLEKETLGRLQGLAKYEAPKKLSIVAEELTIESGMLTPTMKVKRRVVEDRYRDVIEGMYAGGGAA
jgi:long-chain acyl-CoA synthetase